MGQSPSTSVPRVGPLLFLRKFLEHGTRVASISPSSVTLARSLCTPIDPARPQVILELGAGTGAVTAVACQRMHPESRLLAAELDAEFAAITAARCPRAELIVGDVRDLEPKLRERGIGKLDVIISGLPTPSLPRATNAAVLELYQHMAPEAFFSQLTVMPWVYKRMYQRVFEEVRFDLVWRNLPPGGAYHCRRLRPDYAQRIPGK